MPRPDWQGSHSRGIASSAASHPAALNNKYRDTWVDDAGEPQSMPLGTYWITVRSAAVRWWHGVHAAACR